MEIKVELRFWKSSFWTQRLDMPYWLYLVYVFAIGIAVVAVMSLTSCGMAGDPVPDDIYSKNIYPGSNALYAIGSAGLQFAEVYTEKLNGGLAPGTFYDFDGDGKFDPIVYRISNDTIYIMYSSGVGAGYEYYQYFPTCSVWCADYNGDGKTELGIYEVADAKWQWHDNDPDGGDMSQYGSWHTIFWGSAGNDQVVFSGLTIP